MKHLILFLSLCSVLHAADLSIYPTEKRVLDGPDARQQLVLRTDRDVTRAASYSAEPPGIVRITESGAVHPLKSGLTTVKATFEGKTVQTQIEVTQVDAVPPINFPNEIVPLFSKHTCNGGGCHGKAEGQNGFKLSLLGYEPQEDYDHLVRESRGRRIFPAAPEHSLLIRKGTGEYPHGGGARFEPDGYAVTMLRNWIKQGMPYGSDTDPVITGITVYPAETLMQSETEQQLSVTAHYSNGTDRDVTHIAQFESNQKEMAEVSAGGLVTVNDHTGNAAVMVRFQEYVGVYQAIIPLGVEVANLPPAVNFIDTHVFNKLKQLGLPPSPVCDDATFLRRVTIDIAGRLPSMDETKEFLCNIDEKKRAALIDRLLDSEDYADHFANKWSAILRNKRNKESYAHGTFTFHEWIRSSLADNKPYDEFTREIITASGDIASAPPVAWYRQVKTQKDQLQDTAQIFLGVRLQCAECHHHPYEKWSQDDYYGFAAFFSRVGRKPADRPGEEIVYHNRGGASAQNPRSKASLKPTALDAEPLVLSADDDPRRSLADWMKDDNNPFFARMLVNRYWKHFFGRGVIEPEDDIRVTNPATHPRLLQELAGHFVKQDYDMKDLIRTICNSQVYQLSALPNEHNARDDQNYSRYFPKRLSAEVLLDAIDTVTAKPTTFKGLPAGTRAVELPDDSFNSQHYFLTVFGRPEMDSACECERTSDANLAQCLHLLNSKDIQAKLTAGDGTANKLAGNKEQELEQKIRELYHRCFSREPLSMEVDIARDYLKGREGEKLTEGYQDILWALINTKEFLFNH